MNRFLGPIVRATIGMTLAFSVGCPASPPKEADAPPAGKSADSIPFHASGASQETWDVFLLQGKRIGYGWTKTTTLAEADRELLSIECLNHLAIKRSGQTTEEDIRTASVETPGGEMIRFESEMHMGVHPIRTVGRVQGDRLLLETTGAGPAASKTAIPWPAGCLGPFAVEQTLKRRPMQPGERRAIKMLMVGFNQIADVEMTAGQFQPTTLIRGVYDLLRIDTVTRLPDGQKIEGAMWADRTGEALRSQSDPMRLETYRATKAEALDKADVAEFDLLSGSMVRLEQPLPHAHRTKRVRYRVHLDGGDPAGVFVTGASQAVRSIDPHTAEITVDAIRPGDADGNSGAPADPPTDDDRQPNAFIESDDPTIVANAKKAVGDETDPWRRAIALERFVHDEVKTKSFSQAFATAAEVAKSHEGDCTEHAVFLAALCRAVDIPARVAMGLVYMQGQEAFGYHMWTEAYLDGRWIPLDGTLAQGGIGAGHLEVAHSSLKGASAYSAFLPVVQILGRLKIEVIEAK